MDQIKISWETNAGEWVKTIRTHSIESRKITSPAIVSVIDSLSPASMMDVGCGEGWLARNYAQKGVKVLGIDAIESLLNSARELDPASNYLCLDYAQIRHEGILTDDLFDVIVLNFCLYEKEGIEELLNGLSHYLAEKGTIVIQTLHPSAMESMGLSYKDQWMDDSWKGLNGNFSKPHQWFFRTIEGWSKVFSAAGLSIVSLTEPCLPDGKRPLSVIFQLRLL